MTQSYDLPGPIDTLRSVEAVAAITHVGRPNGVNVWAVYTTLEPADGRPAAADWAGGVLIRIGRPCIGAAEIAAALDEHHSHA